MLDMLGNKNGLGTVAASGQFAGSDMGSDAAAWIISAHNLRFKWPKSALRVIDIEALHIKPEERVLVMGPSGSGKTTLLNLLAGVSVPDSGTLHVMGAPLHSLSGSQRDAFRADNIGFVFQMFNLIPYLSLVENVLLPLRFSALRRKKVLDRTLNTTVEAGRLLGHLGLDVQASGRKPVTDLSVGQQQRVAVARALIGGPELVICDEPTSALDADAREAFLELLFQEVARAGATLVFVSHDESLSRHFHHTISLPDINCVREKGGMR
jgi:putative ABC transport system ATP-binding protein